MKCAYFVSHDEHLFEHIYDILTEVPEPPGYLKVLPAKDSSERLIVVRGDSTVWDEQEVDTAIHGWDGGEIPLGLLTAPIATIILHRNSKSLQVWDGKGHFDLDADMDSMSEFELTQPIEDRRGGDGPTSLVGLSVCYIESRPDDLFIRWIEYLARRLTLPSWVLDSNNVLWPALSIDPNELVL